MLSDLVGNGWVMVEPPLEQDNESTIARLDGEPIKSGFLIDRIKDTDDEVHMKYRTGRYDLEVKVDFEIGRGQIKVESAPGYEN